MSQPTINPLKAEQFWAEMRSTAYLFCKSTWPTPEQQSQLALQLRDILGKRITTYPPVYADFGITADTPYKYKKAFLGLGKLYDNSDTQEADQRFMKFMANKAAQANKANWSWRITQEAQQKHDDGWYPFFVTLTVDPKMCMGQTHEFKGRKVKYESVEELWKTGREFRLYIRALSKIVCQLLGHPPPQKKAKNYKGTGIDYGYRPESDYVTYAGVLEHGKTEEHHHLHMMVWMKEIPSHWKLDPNSGRLPGKRYERENKCMRYLWPWAIASQKPAMYYRSKGDIWSQLGHITPTDVKTGKAIKMHPLEVVGNYVTKYMQKGTKVWHHRMKCSRNLGLQRIQKVINTMEMSHLVPLSWKPHKADQLLSVTLIHSVPQGLIRSLAKRRIFSIRWAKKELELKDLLKANYNHYKKMLRSVRDGARPDRMPSHQFYDWVQQHLPEIDGYCKKRLIESHKTLADIFPRTRYKVQPVTLPGNDIGFTQCI